MRLLLLPISTHRVLLYCHCKSIPLPSGQKPPIPERIITFASNTWHKWERAPSGWQRKVTEYGNGMLKRVPYEEWGLKSVPSLSARRREQELAIARKGGTGGTGGEKGVKKITAVEYPGGYIQEGDVMRCLRKLSGEEKQGFHRKWFWGSVAAMPLTLPAALVPVIPNLPFFYLAFRAWSHWRAREGARHIDFLLQQDLTELHTSSIMKYAYVLATIEASIQQLEKAIERRRNGAPDEAEPGGGEEQMILSKQSGKIIAEALDVPALEVEIERAIWQVKRAIKPRRESQSNEAKLER